MGFKRRAAAGLHIFVSVLALAHADTIYPTTGGTAGSYRLLIQRPVSTGVFSGDFSSNSTGNHSSSVASLQPSFTGQYTNLEVVDVNATNSTGSTTLTPAQLCAYLKSQNPDVTSCEPDIRVSKDAGSPTPDDPAYVSGKQWDMPIINTPAVWAQKQYGSKNINVCMIDTGSDLTHPDLQSNLWMNPKEMNGPGATAANGYQNGIDDDGNGIVDDIYGADFVDGSTDSNVQDQNGHGTFVAGVVGAVGNNGIGVTGVNQQVSIITCRFMDASGNGWVSDAIRCIEYCISKGAHVMSNSWGGVEYSASLQTAIDQATQRGVLFVASAGNDGVNTDVTPHYPSSLPDDIVLAVGASTRTDTLWPRSNYGVTSVDIAAPGVQVWNLGLGGNYIYLTGTSMATPHVAGAAALLLAKYQANGFNVSSGMGANVKRLLLSSSKRMAETGTKLMHGRLDIAAAYALVPTQASSSSTASFGSTESAGSIESYDAGSPDSADALANTSYSDNGGVSIITAAGPATAGVIPTSTSGTDNTGASLTFLGNGVVQGPTPGRRLLSQ